MNPRRLFFLFALGLLSPARLPLSAEEKWMGGIIRSDEWILRRDKQEEEFRGNVSYAQGENQIRSDWALSQKRQNLWRARGNTRARRVFKNGDVLTLEADEGRYSTQDQSGVATGNPVKIEIASSSGTWKGISSEAGYDHRENTLRLTGNRPSVWQEGDSWIGAVQADQITFNQSSDQMLAEDRVQGWIHFFPTSDGTKNGKNP